MQTPDQALAGNVDALRDRRRHSVRALSALLEDQGVRLLPSGITKIEANDRRVDVRELMALALVLGVTPNRLLLAAAADETPYAVTPSTVVSARDAWLWARGEIPLNFQGDQRELSEFRSTNRPDQPTELFDADAFRYAEEIKAIRRAVDEIAKRPNMSVDKVLELVRVIDLFEVTHAPAAEIQD